LELTGAGNFAACTIVARNYLATDGYGWGGIFGNGAELVERGRRTADGAIALNGGGGEIYRNFFYLRDGRYSPRQLLWSFYAQFDPSQLTSLFDVETYYRNLERKLFETIGDKPRKLPRPTVEWLYHAFRCRSWDGKVNTINGRFGDTALPFLDRRITNHASRIPIAMKSHGAFESEIIYRVDPRLAAHPSGYGHNFVGAPPRSRILHDLATYLRPPTLRRMTFRLKQWRHGKLTWQGYLGEDFVKRVLPDGVPILGQLFKLSAISNYQHAARILSLEYALAQYGSKLAIDLSDG